jgi:hypothetical protein
MKQTDFWHPNLSGRNPRLEGLPTYPNLLRCFAGGVELRSHVNLIAHLDNAVKMFYDGCMRSEKPRKRMAKKKETEPAPSGFLSGAVSRFLAGDDSQPSTPTLDSDPKRALQKYLLPREVERLKGQLKRLEGQEVARKRAASTGRKCGLWHVVVACKKRHPGKRSNHKFIALYVDDYLKRNNKKLADICPENWKNVRDLPHLLHDALLRDELKGRVRTFISKVEVP